MVAGSDHGLAGGGVFWFVHGYWLVARPERAAAVKDSLGREVDHRTPCDDGKHDDCTDPNCDCVHHGMGWMTQVDQLLHGG